MLETDQKFFVTGVSWWVPDPLVKSLKGDWDRNCFRTIKQLFTEFHSLFVCKVSVGSDW